MPVIAVIDINGNIGERFQDEFNGHELQELKDIFEGNVRNARSSKALGLWDKRTKAWSNGNKIKVRVF
jgi:hypothetical protein